MTDSAEKADGSRLRLPDLERFFPDRPSLGRSLLAVPEHNAIYVRNPKAGCSTVTLWLNRVHLHDPEFLPEQVHRDSRLPRPREIGWGKVVRMLDGGGFRFSFVRNPLKRAQSTWFAKIALQKHFQPALLPLLDLPADHTEPLTFEQFLTAIEQQDPITEMDQHWRPQHVNLLHPLVEYDVVGRLESFDADLAEIRERSGLPDVPVTIPNSRKEGQPDVYAGRPDLVRRVEALYAKDFELYGY